jgi:hypothetical protein
MDRDYTFSVVLRRIVDRQWPDRTAAATSPVKYRLTPFDPATDDAEAWVFRLLEVADALGYTATQTRAWFGTLLAGAKAQAWWSCIPAEEDFPKVCKEFVKLFKGTPARPMLVWATLRQNADESVRYFYWRYRDCTTRSRMMMEPEDAAGDFLH